MLSSNPSVPLHSIDFHGNDQRRLSLRTHEGQEYLTAHDGLPSPEHLTPVSGTPYHGLSPNGSNAGSAPMSRMGSEVATESSSDDGGREGAMSGLQRAPSRRTAGDVDNRVSPILVWRGWYVVVCVVLFSPQIRSSVISISSFYPLYFPLRRFTLALPISHPFTSHIRTIRRSCPVSILS